MPGEQSLSLMSQQG